MIKLSNLYNCLQAMYNPSYTWVMGSKTYFLQLCDGFITNITLEWWITKHYFLHFNGRLQNITYYIHAMITKHAFEWWVMYTIILMMINGRLLQQYIQAQDNYTCISIYTNWDETPVSLFYTGTLCIRINRVFVFSPRPMVTNVWCKSLSGNW